MTQLLSLTTLAALTAASPAPGPSPDLHRLLAPRFEALMASPGFPGFAVAVVHEGRTIYARGFGVADRKGDVAMSSRHAFQIGSATKMFTGYLLARLVEDRVVSLGDPLSRHLPAGTRIPDDGQGGVITLQHLATHTAGLPPYPPNVRKPMRGFTPEEMLQGLGDTRLLHPVGSAFAYSNFGYGLLGAALEHGSGLSYRQLLERYVTEPNGMTSTALDASSLRGVKVAVPYSEHDPREPDEGWRMGALAPAGQVYSTVEDLARWLAFEMSAADCSAVAQTRVPFLRMPKQPAKAYGLGRFLDGTILPDDVVVWHGGNVDSYTSGVIYSPRHRVGLALLTNWGAGPQGEFGDLLFWAFREAVAARPRQPASR